MTGDLRSALRSLDRHRGLNLTIILSLGLAIGANTAVFSVADAFLLRPLPIADIDRVVRLREDVARPGQPPDLRSVGAAHFGRWRESPAFSGVAAGTGVNLTLTGSREPEWVPGARVTANFFPVLGIRPLLGRNFLPTEDRPGEDQAVLLGYDFWRRHFAGDPGALGKVLILDGRARTVIGVMPRGLRHPYGADLWVPLAYREGMPGNDEYYVPARLRPGISLERAGEEMNTFVRRLAVADPRPTAPRGAALSPLRGEMTADFGRILLLLSAAAAFVLLIAALNVANLLLAQSLRQESEVAVRSVLGATRGRLIAQYLTYSVLLSLLGGGLGVLLAGWTVRPLMALSPLYGLGEFDIEPRIDLATLGFTLLIALAAGLLFGLIPALKVSKVSLARTLREDGRSRTLSRGGRRLLDTLVVAELALALVLLVGAGLISRSFAKLQGEDRGFDRGRLLTFTVPFSDFKFPHREQKVEFLRALTARLRALPGVVSAGGSTVQPLDPGTTAAAFNVEGSPAAETRGYHLAHGRTITPGYLEALKVPLLAGRYLDERDAAASPFAVVVSQSFANRYWPGAGGRGERAIGKRVKRGLYGSDHPWLTVVGVVGTLKETQDEVLSHSDAWYLPYAQPIRPDLDAMTLVLRTRGEPAALLPAVRRTLRELDRDVPLFDVATMEERFQRRTTTERFSRGLYGVLALVGLALAAFGIYAVLAFAVGQRLRELGIRAALGARPADLRALILRNGLRLTSVGLALGLAGSLGLTRFLAAQLYQTDPRDPAVLASSLVCLAVLATYSCYVPAQRAAAIDPARSLHGD